MKVVRVRGLVAIHEGPLRWHVAERLQQEAVVAGARPVHELPVLQRRQLVRERRRFALRLEHLLGEARQHRLLLLLLFLYFTHGRGTAACARHVGVEQWRR